MKGKQSGHLVNCQIKYTLCSVLVSTLSTHLRGGRFLIACLISMYPLVLTNRMQILFQAKVCPPKKFLSLSFSWDSHVTKSWSVRCRQKCLDKVFGKLFYPFLFLLVWKLDMMTRAKPVFLRRFKEKSRDLQRFQPVYSSVARPSASASFRISIS